MQGMAAVRAEAAYDKLEDSAYLRSYALFGRELKR